MYYSEIYLLTTHIVEKNTEREKQVQTRILSVLGFFGMETLTTFLDAVTSLGVHHTRIDVNILVHLLFDGDANRISFHSSSGGITTIAGHIEKII